MNEARTAYFWGLTVIAEAGKVAIIGEIDKGLTAAETRQLTAILNEAADFAAQAVTDAV